MIDGTHDTVMGSWMMLGEVISEDARTAVPVDGEMMLVIRSGFDPEIAHVHGLGTAQLDSVVDNASRGGVVGLDGRVGLWKPEFFEGSADGFCLFAVVEEPTKFRFSSGGDDFFEAPSDNENGSVARGWLVVG